MQADKERYIAVLDYVRNSEQYTFRKYLGEHKLLQNATEKGNEIIIPCPFHEDAAPSCFFNDARNTYHCFSCNAHGDLIKFMVDYETNVLGMSITKTQKANDILADDVNIQATLGFSTIFKKVKESFNYDGKFKFKASQVDNRPKSYLELATLMKSKNCSYEKITLAILLMTEQMDVIDIYNAVFKSEVPETSVNDISYDLNAILKGE